MILRRSIDRTPPGRKPEDAAAQGLGDLPKRLPDELSSMLASLGNRKGNRAPAARPALSRENARSAPFLGYAENP